MNKLIVILAIGMAGCAFSATQTSKEYVDAQDTELHNEIVGHKENADNPHGVTADQVGAYTKDEADGKFVSEESDPTVPEWAKSPLPPTAKIESVNGKTGAVELVANDVGAYSKSETDNKIQGAKPGNYSVVSNRAMNAVQEELDPNVPEWAKRVNKPTYNAIEVGARPNDWLPSPAEIGAQPNLVSGTNIKTVNGNSLLGSGNIEIRGAGGGIDTNAVERIANRAVETNAVTVGLQSSVSSLQSSKADKSTTYTKSETDAKLAGKLATSGDGFYFRWSENRSFIDTDAFIYSHDGDFVILEPGGDEWHRLSKKANCPELPVTAGNLAALDENGNLSDSNIGTDDRGIKIEAYGGITSVLLNDGGVYIESYMPGAGEVTVVDNSSYPSVRHDLSAKADRSMISATNPTFSNEVAAVARTVQPTTIRAYDRVRRCWWVLDMVNGVPTWTVEE